MDKLVVENDLLFGRVVELLGQGKQVTIPVKGYSMLPFIRGDRDLVVLEPARSVGPYDIVLFHYGGRYVMHRVVQVRDGVADILGDGVLASHEYCPLPQVYGRAVTILRGGRRAVDPYSPFQMALARLWRRLQPIRRPLLILYRLLPWNWWILLQQRRERAANLLKNTE